jgi:hypothetical protein
MQYNGNDKCNTMEMTNAIQWKYEFGEKNKVYGNFNGMDNGVEKGETNGIWGKWENNRRGEECVCLCVYHRIIIICVFLLPGPSALLLHI